tara:strand:+ start:179 stop:700 length:522 start_codon:yes stop_codon:yes gene_type:complete
VRKNKFFFILIIYFLSIQYSFSQTIAYANLDKIIKKSDICVKIISHFSLKNQKLIDDVKEKEIIIKDKEKSLISQKNILQADEYTKKVNLIRKEIDEFNKNNLEKSRKLNKEKEQITNSFLIEINKVLRDYAQNNKIDIIISSDQMLIGKSSLDVTDELIIDVNNKIKNFKIK